MAQHFLLQHPFDHNDSEATAFSAHLSALSWSDKIMVGGLGDWTLVQDLRQFASQDWLSGSNLNVMLGTMYEKIKVVNPAVELKYKVQNTYFSAQLCTTHVARATYSEA